MRRRWIEPSRLDEERDRYDAERGARAELAALDAEEDAREAAALAGVDECDYDADDAEVRRG